MQAAILPLVALMFLMGRGHLRIYQDIYGVEKTQIELDNTGITLAQKDRDLLIRVEKVQIILQQMDAVHHQFHACAKTPWGALYCSEMDALMHITLEQLQGKFLTLFSTNWNLNGYSASIALKILGNDFSLTKRPADVPLRKKKCSLCALNVELEITKAEICNRLNSNRRWVEAIESRLKKWPLDNAWNFRMGE